MSYQMFMGVGTGFSHQVTSHVMRNRLIPPFAVTLTPEAVYHWPGVSGSKRHLIHMAPRLQGSKAPRLQMLSGGDKPPAEKQKKKSYPPQASTSNKHCYTIMVKRKRTDAPKEDKPAVPSPKTTKSAPTPSESPDAALTVQVITGSYERVLHGFTAGIPAASLKAKTEADSPKFECVDTFLFEAHGSAIRCLALSPLPKVTDSAESQKVMLASGSTDE